MRRIFGEIKKGLTLSNKLVLMFLALSMLPVLVVGFISANVSSNIVKEKEISQRMEQLVLVRNDVTEIIKEIDLAGIRYMLDTNVQTLFSDNDNIAEYDAKMLEFEIEKLIFDNSHKYYNTYWSNSTYLFSNSGIVSSSESNSTVTLNEYFSRPWFIEGLKSGDSKFLGNSETTGNKKIIPYVRLIKDLTTHETTGVVVININEIILRSTYLHDFSADSSSTMIVNRNGNILSHTNKQYIGGNIYDVLGPDAPDSKQNNIYFEIERYGQRMLVIQNTDNTFGWTYYSIVPLSEVLGGAETINRVTIISMAISVSFCVFISYFLSKRVTKPIKNLSRVMKLVETGNLDVSYTVFHYDEIGQLGESFNKMISRLKTSMEESIQIQQIKMEAELKGLEFQINPHFLYNTLSSIIWLADEKRNEEVIKMTKALATFFRISISRGKDMITVQEEVEHVINYMEIQKLRYGDVKFVHDVDMEIKGYYTLKLLLQPIIENAIYHGVRTLKNECGIIKLSGYIDGNDIVLLVYDNGKNMTQERVDFINDALSNNKDGDFGVGLKNVNDRIKLHFGQKFGLTFSIVNEYTLVKIRIPIIESEAGFNVQPDGCR